MTDAYDVLIVGAGPAGLAAARAAASHGARVGLLDAQAKPGGQVWRHDARLGASGAVRRATAALAGVDWLAVHQVMAAEPGALLAETTTGAVWLRYGKLVLACGARELLLPFPGWTLPGVTGAGALQVLTKQGWPVTGKRIVVAGSGPLLLAVAAGLRTHGASVLGIHEQAPATALAAFARQLPRWPARALQALQLRARLVGVPYRTGSIVRRALGRHRLEAVEIEDKQGSHRVACNYLAVGYGLVPNTELAVLLGCALAREGTHPGVQVNAFMRSSVLQIYAAGELCGIAGLAAARIEGAMAGHAAAGDARAAGALQPARTRARRFGALLEQTFTLDPQLHHLVAPDTIVCRCEDVRWAELSSFTDARSSKLATRCGMGACQGRICGSALAEIGRFARQGSRPPLFPTRLDSLALANTHALSTEETD